MVQVFDKFRMIVINLYLNVVIYFIHDIVLRSEVTYGTSRKHHISLSSLQITGTSGNFLTSLENSHQLGKRNVRFRRKETLLVLPNRLSHSRRKRAANFYLSHVAIEKVESRLISLSRNKSWKLGLRVRGCVPE